MSEADQDVEETSDFSDWLENRMVPPKRLRGEKMKRDMGLIREIMVEIQSWEDLDGHTVSLAGHDDEKVQRHVEMLWQEGFLDIVTHHRSLSATVTTVKVRDLSWQGHEFIGLLVEEKWWSLIKQRYSAKELATIPLKLIQKTGEQLITAYIIRRLLDGRK